LKEAKDKRLLLAAFSYKRNVIDVNKNIIVKKNGERHAMASESATSRKPVCLPWALRPIRGAQADACVE